MTRPGFIFEDKTSVPNEVEEDECGSSIQGKVIMMASLKQTSNNVIYRTPVDELLRVVFCEQEAAGVSELFAQSRNYD